MTTTDIYTAADQTVRTICAMQSLIDEGSEVDQVTGYEALDYLVEQLQVYNLLDVLISAEARRITRE